MEQVKSKVLGGLRGAMLGDAMGAITETLSRRQIREAYGWLDDFQRPIIKPYGQDRTPGEITDDASLILAMMEATESSRITVEQAVKGVMEWAADPRYSRYAGPSTKRAIAMIQEGADPLEVGKGDVTSFTGASNGGAMKVAPAGWAARGDVELAVENAAAICGPTHNTQLAIAGAAAVAAACTAALEPNATLETVIAAAVSGAHLGNEIGMRQGREVAGPDVALRIEQAISYTSEGENTEVLNILADRIGVGLATAETVPVAIALVAMADGNPEDVAIYSANIGDDTDTVGCIAGAIAGTLSGASSIRSSWIELMEKVNQINSEDVVNRFLICTKE